MSGPRGRQVALAGSLCLGICVSAPLAWSADRFAIFRGCVYTNAQVGPFLEPWYSSNRGVQRTGAV